MRGEKSCGYIVPSFHVSAWANYDITPEDVGTEFDTIGTHKILEKYVVKTREPRNRKEGTKPRLSRLVEGQVHLHVDTENLRKNAHKIDLNDTISITYKTHGTSWWVSNVLVKRKLSLLERLLRKVGAKVQETEYDLIYGSRKVVKNKHLDDPKKKDHYFGYDLWKDIKDKVTENAPIPKGYSLYGEALGYDKNGKAIQKDYDYGCNEGEMKIEVYRVTHTNPDGLVTELSYPEMKEFCDKMGLMPSHLFYYGTVENFCIDHEISTISSEHEQENHLFPHNFIKLLEEKYNDKKCFICKNSVWEEGIVLRKESLFHCESFKLKSFNFLEAESAQLDKGESDIESEN